MTRAIYAEGCVRDRERSRFLIDLKAADYAALGLAVDSKVTVLVAGCNSIYGVVVRDGSGLVIRVGGRVPNATVRGAIASGVRVRAAATPRQLPPGFVCGEVRTDAANPHRQWVALTTAAARELGAKVGDRVMVHAANADMIPGEFAHAGDGVLAVRVDDVLTSDRVLVRRRGP